MYPTYLSSEAGYSTVLQRERDNKLALVEGCRTGNASSWVKYIA